MTNELDIEALEAAERAVRTAFAVYMKSHEPPIKGIVADLTDIAAEAASRAVAAVASDRFIGTPCAEIRWEQERDTLKSVLRIAIEALQFYAARDPRAYAATQEALAFYNQEFG